MSKELTQRARVRRKSRKTRVVVAGLGTALPGQAIAQSDAAEIAASLTGSDDATRRYMANMYERCGVNQRYSVVLQPTSDGDRVMQNFYYQAVGAGDGGPSTADRMRQYEQHAGAMAVTASGRALQQAGAVADEITHLVTVSCTGFSAPGVDYRLIEGLGLVPHVQRTHVGFMGCHGVLNGLRVAKAIVEADPRSVVLVCAVELCSLHHQYGFDPQEVIANALFADGAAAVVLRGAGDGDAALPQLLHTASRLVPGTASHMSWRIGDHGFAMTLSPQVPVVLQDHLRPWVTEWLSDGQLTLDDIRSWAIHPGGPKILDACESALGLSPAQMAPSRSVLAEFGNMSSPTVLFILERLCQQGDVAPTVLMAFGPGLTLEAMLLG